MRLFVAVAISAGIALSQTAHRESVAGGGFMKARWGMTIAQVKATSPEILPKDLGLSIPRIKISEGIEGAVDFEFEANRLALVSVLINTEDHQREVLFDHLKNILIERYRKPINEKNDVSYIGETQITDTSVFWKLPAGTVTLHRMESASGGVISITYHKPSKTVL